jgi:pumilio RNA-binding family
MQKCIDGADTEEKIQLTYEIAKNTLTFVKNPYGNYVVQYVLELKNLEVNKRIG